ncbi:MAG: sigma-70 family RNA polymerase sigma factor [Sedimentisphaerales bacterium]|nr:sigma-70 family RNA polymerase sigma factor [Sedimentisphaerales bacterium]
MGNGKQSNQNRRGQEREFLDLYLPNIRRLYAFISCVVPNWSDVDDIFQQVTTIMWTKFEQFEAGTNFMAWAMKIAHYEVLMYRKKKRYTGLHFSEELIEQIVDRAKTSWQEQDNRKQALTACLKDLRENDRQLLQRRYEHNIAPRHLADVFGCSMDAIYQRLNRLHHRLLHCIRRRLAMEESI